MTELPNTGTAEFQSFESVPAGTYSGSTRSLTYRSAVNDRLALMHAITQQLGVVIGDAVYDNHAKLLTGAFEELLAETRNLLKEDLT